MTLQSSLNALAGFGRQRTRYGHGIWHAINPDAPWEREIEITYVRGVWHAKVADKTYSSVLLREVKAQLAELGFTQFRKVL